MGNSIKHSGEGLALQITEDARSAGFVEENNEGEATSLADVRIHAFDDLLLVIDRDTDHVKTEGVAELVASAARDTKSVYRSMDASVQISGHGYQTQLPPAEDAGFTEGRSTSVLTTPGMLVICRERSKRLADDLVSIRRDQVNKRMNHE